MLELKLKKEESEHLSNYNKGAMKHRSYHDLQSLHRLKIAYLIEKFPLPTESFILNEIIELEKKDIEVCLLVVRKQKRYFDIPDLKYLKSSIVYLPRFCLIFSFLQYLFSMSTLFRFPFFSVYRRRVGLLKCIRDFSFSLFFYGKLKGKDIDHIHAHFAFIAVDIAYILSRLLRIKYSFTAHAQDIYTNAIKIKNDIQEAAFTITCTKYNREYLNNITDFKYENRIITAHHGIDSSRWLSGKFKKNPIQSEINILSVARLVEKKGLIYLLKAIRILTLNGHNVRCTIIGEGPLKEELIKFIKENQLVQFVKILNFMHQEELKKYYYDSNLFVLPCTIAKNGDRDGIPNVMLEAMIMEIPVISTPVSAISEVIEDRVTGLMVKEKDEHAIVNAILELKNDNELYYKVIKNSRIRLFDEFEIKNCTTALVSLFQKHVKGYA